MASSGLARSIRGRMTEIIFRSDTKQRKQWFTGLSFSHPAKMMLPLQLYLIDRYSKVGDVILDPMAGSGTILVACSMGRHVVTCELEQKFVDMQKGNWEKIKQRGPQMGYEMGTATILCGDARNLEGLLADVAIFSPPYAEASEGAGIAKRGYHGDKHSDHDIGSRSCMPSNQGKAEGQIGNLKYGNLADVVITSPPYAHPVGGGDLEKRLKRLQEQGYLDLVRQYHEGNPKARNFVLTEYSDNPDNLGNLPYGKVDAVITSPPYFDSPTGGGLNTKPPRAGHKDQGGRSAVSPSQAGAGTYSESKVDCVITSPPYEGMKQDDKRANDPKQIDKRAKEFEKAGGDFHTPGRMATIARAYAGYTSSQANIGNLKSTSYLQAMYEVYCSCWNVLKDNGLLVLVTKNFIRNKQIVRLDTDTISLCEKAQFTFVERLERKLTQQSFWRVIYREKYPDAPIIAHEDVLVFRKVI